MGTKLFCRWIDPRRSLPSHGFIWEDAGPAEIFHTDRDRQSAVHFQQIHGGPARRGNARDAMIFPIKMVVPDLLPWVKHVGCASARRVDGRSFGSFAKRAGDTGQIKVFGLRTASRGNWINVINIECGLPARLRTSGNIHNGYPHAG